MRYEVKAPIYFVGQVVSFVNRGNRKRLEQRGMIRQVKTNYFLQDGGSIIRGGHVYLIKADGKEMWIRENNITGVAV